MYVDLQPLADAYGLLMHRNGEWEWTLAPGVSPSPRYQHAAVSISFLFDSPFTIYHLPVSLSLKNLLICW